MRNNTSLGILSLAGCFGVAVFVLTPSALAGDYWGSEAAAATARTGACSKERQRK